MWPWNKKKKEKKEKIRRWFQDNRESSHYSSTPSDSSMFNPLVYNFDDDINTHHSHRTEFGGGDFGGAGAGSSWDSDSSSSSDSGGDSGGGDGGGDGGGGGD